MISRSSVHSSSGFHSPEPLVSILTPSFNQARWLGDALESVARQTYKPVEHIVVDGGSTDGTVDVLRAASPGLRWISEPDRGQSHALNKAYALSSGDIIGWLNSDDAYFSTRAVETAVRAFQRHPDAAVVYGHSALVDSSGRLLHFNWAPPFSKRILRFHNFIVQPAAFVRRAVLGDVLVDECFEYSMDRELWLRLTGSHAAVRVDEVFAVDRHHLKRKSYARLDLYRDDLGLLVERYSVPPIGAARARLKLAKVIFRLIGIKLALDRGARRDPAFSVDCGTTVSLVVRQTLTPRRLMTS